jgi:uncharacterized protein YeaO (DUF488 family)
MMKLKRVYDAVERGDGRRFLVERLWPRGVKKEALADVEWLREVAPSTELRKWFSHRSERWKEFRRRYTKELNAKPDAWAPLVRAARRGNVTLLFSSKELDHNNAVVLKSYLERKIS